LTGTDVAAAALAVADREGLGGVSMRAVAAELGVGTMSLYRYVEDRQALEDLMVELVLEPVDLTVSDRATWQRNITTLASRTRDAIGAHPVIVPILLTRRHVAAATRRWGEAVLGQLARGGFEDRDRVVAFRTILSYVLGAVQVEHLGPLRGPGTASLAAEATDRFPHLAATAAAARRVTPDQEFRRGLDIVLRGLEASDG
jgi:AcrR family transcriptional regulator